MSYSTFPTVVTGDSWSAAQHNTYIRDNFTALWPYTTAGDISYAISGTVLTRLGIGTENYVLGISSNSPAWIDATNLTEKQCLIKRTTTQNIINNTQTLITFESEVYDNFSYWSSSDPTKIILPKAGYYRLSGSMTWDVSSTGYRAIYIGETATLVSYVKNSSDLETTTSFNYTYKTTIDNVITYLWVKQNTGGNLNVTGQYYITYLGA